MEKIIFSFLITKTLSNFMKKFGKKEASLTALSKATVQQVLATQQTVKQVTISLDKRTFFPCHLN
jgi:mRNA-degrading endonuclease HigB of HigAB toxin-antitoxin module